MHERPGRIEQRCVEMLHAAANGGRRVVQFVGNSGRKRAQLGHLFALAQEVLGVLPARHDDVEQGRSGRRADLQQLSQVRPADTDHVRVGSGSHGRRSRRVQHQRNLAEHLARAARGQQDFAVLAVLDDFNFAGLDDVGGVADAAVLEQNFAGRQVNFLHDHAQAFQVVIREFREQGDHA